jgi:DNA repair exonuclease SbcCD ATPase subunit
MTEQLTEAERARLGCAADWGTGEHAGRKALRVIDALTAQVAAAEAELTRLGYGTEDTHIFGSDGRPIAISRVGDLCWDTAEQRRAAFEYIANAQRALDVEGRLAAEWKARAAELEVELDVLATRCETAERERDEADHKADETLGNLERLRDTCSDRAHSMAQLRAELAAAKARAETAERELHSVDEAQANEADALVRAEKAEAECAAMRAEVESLSASLRAALRDWEAERAATAQSF